MSKPRVVLISDVPGWAFDQNMHSLAEYLGKSFSFDFFYVEHWNRGERGINWNDYDAVWECYHRNPEMGIPRDRCVGSLRGQWFNNDQPGPPTDENIAHVNSFAGFQFVSSGAYDLVAGRCPNAVWLPNPANMKRFPVASPLKSTVIAEWNGNDTRRIKHFRDVVEPACEKAGVKLVSAEYNTKTGPSRRRSYEEMTEFYLQANVALSASEYEGCSNSVMEAMASGLAVIATDVGNHREMRDTQMTLYGDTGIFLVERTVEAFTEALCALTPERAQEMGKINRREIEDSWSWNIWAPHYEHLLRKVCRT